jgi:hypothetical protein
MVVLIAVHAALVLFTLFCVFGVAVTVDPHDGCKYHGVGCDEAARAGQAAWIGLVGSAVLVILDIVVTIWLHTTRRSAFVVPLLCCVGQLIVLATVFVLSAGTA